MCVCGLLRRSRARIVLRYGACCERSVMESRDGFLDIEAKVVALALCHGAFGNR
jgi:hypothetical protein